MLQAIGEHLGVTQSSGGAVGLTTREIFQATLQDFKGAHYKALFATKRLGLHTADLAHLVNYWDRVPIVLQLSALISGDTIYTRLFAVSHIPQLLHRVGRGHCRSSLCCISGNQSFRPPVDDGSFAIKTGVFLFACVRINTATASLAFACITGVLANFEYAVMYTFTPESFRGPHRGIDARTAAALLRFGGLAASLVSTYSGFTTAPIYASAALWITVGVLCFALPFKTHRHAAI